MGRLPKRGCARLHVRAPDGTDGLDSAVELPKAAQGLQDEVLVEVALRRKLHDVPKLAERDDAGSFVVVEEASIDRVSACVQAEGAVPRRAAHGADLRREVDRIARVQCTERRIAACAKKGARRRKGANGQQAVNGLRLWRRVICEARACAVAAVQRRTESEG